MARTVFTRQLQCFTVTPAFDAPVATRPRSVQAPLPLICAVGFG